MAKSQEKVTSQVKYGLPSALQEQVRRVMLQTQCMGSGYLGMKFWDYLKPYMRADTPKPRRGSICSLWEYPVKRELPESWQAELRRGTAAQTTMVALVIYLCGDEQPPCEICAMNPQYGRDSSGLLGGVNQEYPFPWCIVAGGGLWPNMKDVLWPCLKVMCCTELYRTHVARQSISQKVLLTNVPDVQQTRGGSQQRRSATPVVVIDYGTEEHSDSAEEFDKKVRKIVDAIDDDTDEWRQSSTDVEVPKPIRGTLRRSPRKKTPLLRAGEGLEVDKLSPSKKYGRSNNATPALSGYSSLGHPRNSNSLGETDNRQPGGRFASISTESHSPAPMQTWEVAPGKIMSGDGPDAESKSSIFSFIFHAAPSIAGRASAPPISLHLPA